MAVKWSIKLQYKCIIDVQQPFKIAMKNACLRLWRLESYQIILQNRMYHPTSDIMNILFSSPENTPINTSNSVFFPLFVHIITNDLCFEKGVCLWK